MLIEGRRLTIRGGGGEGGGGGGGEGGGRGGDGGLGGADGVPWLRDGAGAGAGDAEPIVGAGVGWYVAVHLCKLTSQ